VDARQARRGKRISLQQEKRAAAELGGKTTAASGAAKFSGGADVRVMGKIRLECKFTEKSEYTLRFLELQKVRKQAMRVLEQPVLQFAFHHTTGRLKAYAVIPWNMGDTPKETDHSWYTSATSISLSEDKLDRALLVGRIQFTFMCPGSITLPFRVFEIMNWHDFVETTMLKHEVHEDAGDQYNSAVSGSPDAIEG
jgi:hypothetical protein